MSHEIALIPLDSDEDFLVQRVNDFSVMAERFKRGQIMSHALQGLYLSELRKRHGNSTRGNPKLRNSPNNSENWPDFVKKTFGFTDDTAKLRILVWEAARARMAKLQTAEQQRIVEILSGSLAQLKGEDVALLEDATHKVTNHATEVELIAEAKFIRQPHGTSAANAKKNAEPSTEPHAGPLVTVDEQIEEQLELFSQSTLLLEKTHKVGERDVLLIASWPKTKLKVALEAAKRSVVLLNKVLQEKA